MARAVVDIRSMARTHTEKALKTLAAIMRQTKAPPAARVAAAQALLDRGWGKPTQVVTGDESGLPITVIHRVIVSLPVADPRDIDANFIEVGGKCEGHCRASFEFAGNLEKRRRPRICPQTRRKLPI